MGGEARKAVAVHIDAQRVEARHVHIHAQVDWCPRGVSNTMGANGPKQQQQKETNFKHPYQRTLCAVDEIRLGEVPAEGNGGVTHY